jgi:hypothetical protein
VDGDFKKEVQKMGIRGKQFVMFVFGQVKE